MNGRIINELNILKNKILKPTISPSLERQVETDH